MMQHVNAIDFHNPLEELRHRQKDTGRHAQMLDQFYPMARILSPERALMHAILEDALKMLQDYAERKTHRHQAFEAFEWANEDSEDVFGFGRICEELGLNPGAVRSVVNNEFQGLFLSRGVRSAARKAG